MFWGLREAGGWHVVHIAVPLAAAEPYGDALTFAPGHAEVWAAWQALGPVGLRRQGLPAAILAYEYDHVPRGRVVHHCTTELFTIYADRRPPPADLRADRARRRALRPRRAPPRRARGSALSQLNRHVIQPEFIHPRPAGIRIGRTLAVLTPDALMPRTALVSQHAAPARPDAVPAVLDPAGLGPLERVPLIPEALRRRRHVFVPADTRFKAAARFLQALWREDRGLPIGTHTNPAGKRRQLGSRISLAAGEQDSNFMTPEILPVVSRALAYRELGAVYELDRLKTNLLSSQPLAFNLFAPLLRDPALATGVMAELFPGLLVEVAAILFEHSPGRGDPRFTADGTAYDVVVHGRSATGERVLVAIELKYSEGCHEPAARMSGRYDEIAPTADLFVDPADPALMRNPHQQLFRQHCLATTILRQGLADRAVLAFIAPTHNQLARGAALSYSRRLRDPAEGVIPFVALSLERVITAIAAAGPVEHARALHRRYTDFWLIDGELALDGGNTAA